MADKREQILARLQTLVGGLSGIRTSERNETNFGETQLPAVTVLEGDEEVSDTDVGRNRPASRPYIVTMRPNVVFRADEDAADVGTTLNALRAAAVRTVLADSELLALTMDGNGIRYAGSESTLHAARSMVGAMSLTFAVTYVLNPSDL